VVDRVRTAGVPRCEEVAQHGAAHASGGSAGADDGDRAGCEKALHGAGLRALFAATLDRERFGGRFEVEGEMDGAVLEAALLGVARVPEHFDHLVVGSQHLGDEAPDAALTGDLGDVLQQRGGDAAPLVGVLDQEGDLGLVGDRRGGRGTLSGKGGGGDGWARAGRPCALIRS
jgi:hypothetical protein